MESLAQEIYYLAIKIYLKVILTLFKVILMVSWATTTSLIKGIRIKSLEIKMELLIDHIIKLQVIKTTSVEIKIKSKAEETIYLATKMGFLAT